MKINLLEETIVDWRGSRIAPGAVVLYHSPNDGIGGGFTVEGVVSDPWTTPAGYIRIRTLRASHHRMGVQNVAVRREKITVTTPAAM